MKRNLKPGRFAAVSLITLLVAGASGVCAQDYPTRPIRMIVPYVSGGGLDFVARTLGAKLAERSGHPVVIDNRPGASGSVGANIVARAAPDGYTVMLTSSSALAANPALQRLSFKAIIKDFAPVSLVSSVAYVLVVHPSVPAKSVAELIRLAKPQPGRINYASSGIGSSAHLAMELFKNMAGVDLVHIPYNSSLPVIALIGGHVQAGFYNLTPALPHVRSGKLRALGVSSSTRWAGMPDVPTIAESGLPGYEALQWYGMLMPAGAPRVIIHRLQQEIAAILQLLDVQERVAREGGVIIGSTPEQFAGYIEREIAKWTKVVTVANIRVD